MYARPPFIYFFKSATPSTHTHPPTHALLYLDRGYATSFNSTVNVFDINVANIRLNDKTFVEEIKRKQQLGPSAYRRPLSHKRSAVLHWFWLTVRFRFSVKQLYHCEQIRHPLNTGTTAWTNLTSFCWSFIYILCEFWRAVVSFLKKKHETWSFLYLSLDMEFIFFAEGKW